MSFFAWYSYSHTEGEINISSHFVETNLLLFLRKGGSSYSLIRTVQNRLNGFNYIFLLYQYNLLKWIRCNWNRLINFERFRLENKMVLFFSRKGAYFISHFVGNQIRCILFPWTVTLLSLIFWYQLFNFFRERISKRPFF